ncbi:MAG: hydroxymethylbilane synthase, partial [Acidobacteriota bacterium]
MTWRLGTRRSRLARAQARSVARRLEALGEKVQVVPLDSRGDRVKELPFEQIGAPGLFVRELESALLDHRVDLVVHSYKDLPTAGPAGLTIAAVPERLDPTDSLVAKELGPDHLAGGALPLRPGARVGTASARRRALIHALRPDVEVVHLRGNVPTRLQAVRDGTVDAAILATAGLDRLVNDGLDLEDLVPRRLDPTIFVPAPSQGALAVQVRTGTTPRDLELQDHLKQLDDLAARPALAAERHLQKAIEGGCQVAFGAWCRRQPDTDADAAAGTLRLNAVLDTPAGLRRANGEGADP